MGRPAEIYVVYTSIDETFAALRVADGLARALAVPLTLIHFRTVSYAVPGNRPLGCSPVETDAFVQRLREEGLDARLRVFVCRDVRQAIPVAFRRQSLVVVGGRRRWWPTRSQRWRRSLESAGHLVLFVNEARHAA